MEPLSALYRSCDPENGFGGMLGHPTLLCYVMDLTPIDPIRQLEADYCKLRDNFEALTDRHKRSELDRNRAEKQYMKTFSHLVRYVS